MNDTIFPRSKNPAIFVQHTASRWPTFCNEPKLRFLKGQKNGVWDQAHRRKTKKTKTCLFWSKLCEDFNTAVSRLLAPRTFRSPHPSLPLKAGSPRLIRPTHGRLGKEKNGNKVDGNNNTYRSLMLYRRLRRFRVTFAPLKENTLPKMWRRCTRGRLA